MMNKYTKIFKYAFTILFALILCVNSDAKNSWIKPIVIGADTSKVHVYSVNHEKIKTPKFTKITSKNDSIKKQEAIENEEKLKIDDNQFYKNTWKGIGFIASICMCAFLMDLILTLLIKFKFKHKKQE